MEANDERRYRELVPQVLALEEIINTRVTMAVLDNFGLSKHQYE